MNSVDYSTFVTVLPQQIRDRYRAVHGHESADSDLAHNLWRVGVENMPAAEMLNRIDPAWQPTAPPIPTTDPLAMRGDWLTFRLNGRVFYLGDNAATNEGCAAYRAQSYTDILVASVLGPQPGADAPFDLFGQPDAYAERCAGFQSRGVRAIGQIGFEDAWDVWAKYRADFPAHIRRLVQAADPHVSSWLWGVEIDEGITRGHYTWDDLIGWMRVLAEVSQRPQLVHFRQTAWGPEGDAPWAGGQQASWWRAVRAALPTTPLACAFQHRHDKPAHKRANGGFLSPQSDVFDHVTALNAPKRLGGIDVNVISFEYAWNGTDNQAQVVTETEARDLGRYALSVGAYGAMNGV